jgi:putative sterol carrier protein
MSTTADAAKVAGIFDHLGAEGQVQFLRNTNAVFEFDIYDGGHWYMKLDHGTPSIQNEAANADCVIGCSASDFVAIAEGNQNLVTAFLQGRIKCTGDIALALDFRRMVPVAA